MIVKSKEQVDTSETAKDASEELFQDVYCLISENVIRSKNWSRTDWCRIREFLVINLQIKSDIVGNMKGC